MNDTQNKEDKRGIEIQKVGIKNFQLPIYVRDRDATDRQPSVGTFNVYSSLPKELKGVHMSHFASVLQAQCLNENISLDHLIMVKDKIKEEQLEEMPEEVDDIEVHLEMAFVYFNPVQAPASGERGKLPIDCKFTVSDLHSPILQVRVPVTTLCPCSKEIATDYRCPRCGETVIDLPAEITGIENWAQEIRCMKCKNTIPKSSLLVFHRGAHNQRSFITIAVQTNEWTWIEELVDYAQRSASCPVYPILRRKDEMVVTRQAFNNPKFVEDVIRDLELLIKGDKRVNTYKLLVENEESIHVHNAYAETESASFGEL